MYSIDPDKTIAILVGIDSYTHNKLHALPASFGNVSDMGKFLHEKFGIRTDKIRRIISITSGEFLNEIETFIEENTEAENLFFYYAGHALPPVIQNNGTAEYYITAKDTDPTSNRTKINCAQLFGSLRNENSFNLIAIFDCCFSANIFDSMPLGSNCFVMASSANHEYSEYPLNQQLSTFTKKIIEVLNNGVPGKGEKLSARDVFNYTAELLNLEEAPAPVSGGVGNTGDVPFIKNFNSVEEGAGRTNYYDELIDLYNAIVREEKDVFGANKPKLVSNDMSIETERTNTRSEMFSNPEFLKSLILKRYPIVISYLLKQFLYPIDEKKMNDAFYEEMYTQVLRFLCFIVIKDLADHKYLQKDYKNLIEKIWGPVNREWYFNVLEKGVHYSGQLQIKEFSVNADFFKTIAIIEKEKFATMTNERVVEIFGQDGNEMLGNKFRATAKEEGFVFRTFLFKLMEELSFFVKYNMIAIKLIKVIRGYFAPVTFQHDISNLYGDSYQSYSHEFSTQNACYHNGTVIILPKTAAPEVLLAKEEYINLWPLVIDKNGSNLDSTKEPEIHIFQYAEKNPLEFYYRIATKEREMFSGTPKKYNQLIQFPTLEERKKYFDYFKANIGLDNATEQST
ncbi:MAG: caspase family protein [Bacteroidetes bacterium]|nr:MAG: caspase family protein [Bacteroidota bacterium]